MEIKCPKCRFRFEEDIPEFINETSCVCPRCGTPFVYTRTMVVGEEIDTQINKEKAIYNEEATNDSNINNSLKEITENPQGHSSAKSQASYVKTTIDFINYTEEKKHKKGSLPLILSFIIIISIIIVAIAIRCSSNRALYSDEDYTMFVPSDVDYSASDGSEDLNHEPEWIQGQWEFHSEFFDIIITIDGNKIIERENDHISEGTFTYDKEKLICDFGNNSIFIYRLDFTDMTIDCGNGLVMKKIK